jgi:hypothetical protein
MEEPLGPLNRKQERDLARREGGFLPHGPRGRVSRRHLAKLARIDPTAVAELRAKYARRAP